MFSKSLLAVAAALFPFTSASADIVGHDLGLKLTPGQGGASLELPGPDLKRGMPDGMEIRVSVGLSGFIELENLNKPGGQVAVLTAYGVDVSGFSGALQAHAGGQFAQTTRVDMFDGKKDFAGLSAARFATNDFSTGMAQRFRGKQLDRMLRTVNPKAMTVNISGGAFNSVIGLDNFAANSETQMYVQVRVMYFYAGSSANNGPIAALSAAGFLAQTPSAIRPSAFLAVSSTPK